MADHMSCGAVFYRSKTKLLQLLAVLLAAVVPFAQAQSDRADTRLSGSVRISGSPADKALLDVLQAAFSARHPAVAFTQSLYGPESTLAGVYTGTADLALMGRELREPMERMAYEWAMLDKPLLIAIAEAGIESPRLSTQLGVFVHRDNPLRQLSLRQLDAIYGAEPRRGSTNLRSWGQLVREPTWAHRPIRVHGPAVDSVQALHLRRVVLKDSRKWNPEYRQANSEGRQVVEAVADDVEGIGFGPVRDALPGVRLLALSEDDDGQFYLPNVDSIRAGNYPLGRTIGVVPARGKEKPMRPEVKAFVSFLLSADGQAIIQRDGSYLPLSEKRVAAERGKLP